MHNDDFASSDHYRVGNSKLHTANAISLQTLRSSQEPIKLIGEFLDTLTQSIGLVPCSIIHVKKIYDFFTQILEQKWDKNLHPWKTKIAPFEERVFGF